MTEHRIRRKHNREVVLKVYDEFRRTQEPPSVLWTQPKPLSKFQNILINSVLYYFRFILLGFILCGVCGIISAYIIHIPPPNRDVSALLIFIIIGWPVLTFAGFIFDQLYWANRPVVQPCAHGIADFKSGGCPACAVEKAADEATRAAAAAEVERRNAIQLLSRELRKQEIARLSSIAVAPIADLRELAPYKFETLVSLMFERLGYQVEQTPASNDHGRDGLLRKDGKLFLFECKRYREGARSGRPELQKFHSAIITDKADGGYFITTGGFSRSAIAFVDALAGPPITLVGPDALLRLLDKSLPNAGGSKTYRTICVICGGEAGHELPANLPRPCPAGHLVEPSIRMEDIFSFLAEQRGPICPRCEKPMRIVDVGSGKFWGCSSYPRCRSTRPFQAHRLASP